MLSPFPIPLPLFWRAKRLYVRFMLSFIGHGLAKASRTDYVIRKEITVLPDGFTFVMGVAPAGPYLCMKKDGHNIKLWSSFECPNVTIQFKHLAHAFTTLSFRAGAADAFARERMIVDGDLPAAMKLVRCLERLEVLTLPKLIGCKVMRHYPNISLKEKLSGALQIYLGVVVGLGSGGLAK